LFKDFLKNDIFTKASVSSKHDCGTQEQNDNNIPDIIIIRIPVKYLLITFLKASKLQKY